jgi:hypothetical protein
MWASVAFGYSTTEDEEFMAAKIAEETGVR